MLFRVRAFRQEGEATMNAKFMGRHVSLKKVRVLAKPPEDKKK